MSSMSYSAFGGSAAQPQDVLQPPVSVALLLTAIAEKSLL